MGKPIAGRNKTPFGIGGINVDAAVLKDGTKLTNIKVSKQKSSNLFDLISTDGVTLYRSLKITTTDKNGQLLLNTDTAQDLSDKLLPGTFCISVFDALQNEIVGFALKLQQNKIILGNDEVYYISSYSSQGDTTVYVTGVTLNKLTSAIKVGLTEQLTANIAPANATDKTVTWSTSAASIATVSTSGLVTGVANGTANIVATTNDGSFTSTCAYTVTTAVTGVTLNKTTGSGVVGSTDQLTATVAPTTASNKTINWTTSSSSIATVNTSGLVTFSANGSVTITATTADGAKTATCAYTVTTNVASVTLAPTTATLAVAGTQQLTPTVLPATASVKTVSYSSSNTNVATVNASGLVTAVAAGTATITVTTTNSSKTATCVITVS